METPLLAHIEAFSRRRVLIVGDLILDHYIRGSVSRTSPEAPVPILHVEEEEHLPGGAANVAKNVTSLGGRAEIIGVAGNDEAGQTLHRLLTESAGLKPHLVIDNARPTTLKTRCMAQGQQMIRLDREIAEPVSDNVMRKALALVEKRIAHCDGVILSDYGKGFLREDFLQGVIALAKERGLKVLVDPKGRNYRRYRGASVLTPNQKEASDESGIAVVSAESAAAAAKTLQKMVDGEAIVITRGAAGVSVFPRRGRPSHISAQAREVFDVTGAGDTMIAALGLSLFSGAPLGDAAAIGNYAAGIVVGLAGVATVTAEQVRRAIEGVRTPTANKFATPEELEPIVRSLHLHGRRIVFTNGFFDLFHHGHLRLLEAARQMGDCLIVAMNSDASTRRLRGAPRPLLRIDERRELLSALPYVDYITVFDEDTPENLLKRLRPDILVKGTAANAAKEEAVGHEIVEAYGGTVKFYHFEKDSPRTSAILDRAREKKTSKRKASK